MSNRDSIIFSFFLNASFFNLFFITEPHKAHVEVAISAIKAKRTAKIKRILTWCETGARKVENSVSPYTATLGLKSCRQNPLIKAFGASFVLSNLLLERSIPIASHMMYKAPPHLKYFSEVGKIAKMVLER